MSEDPLARIKARLNPATIAKEVSAQFWERSGPLGSAELAQVLVGGAGVPGGASGYTPYGSPQQPIATEQGPGEQATVHGPVEEGPKAAQAAEVIEPQKPTPEMTPAPLIALPAPQGRETVFVPADDGTLRPQTDAEYWQGVLGRRQDSALGLSPDVRAAQAAREDWASKYASRGIEEGDTKDLAAGM